LIKFINELFPLNRSLAGNDNRKTLKIIKSKIPKLKIKSFDSGNKVFDWTIPKEWEVSDAYVLDETGKKIIDYKICNLHLATYSIPFEGYLSSKQLLKKIITHKTLKNAIPYKTLYYKKDWLFCLSKNQLEKIKKNKSKFYFIKINTKFTVGKMNYGELLIPGKSNKEILISTYICHPSLANNELSGMVMTTYLARHFQNKILNYSIRFLFIPETIGSISYIKYNLKNLKNNFLAGFIVTCVGDNGKFSILKPKNENCVSYKTSLKVLKDINVKFKLISFLKRGSDERQYSWPGVDLNFTSIMRTKYGSYKEYHTSLDNLSFISSKNIKETLKLYIKIINKINKSLFPQTISICEPFYENKNFIDYNSAVEVRLINNFLIYSDGLTSIEELSGILKINSTKCMNIYKFLKINELVV
jgi:aminopeptidase-like protein